MNNELSNISFYMLSIQKSIPLEIGLLTCTTSCVSWSVHSATPFLWKLVCWVSNFDNHSHNIMGNYAKKISWISKYRYHCTQFSGLGYEPSLSFNANINVFDSNQSLTSLLVGCHKISLVLIKKVPTTEPFVGHFS